MCVDEGCDYIGLIFAPSSPRRIKPALARRITRQLPREVGPVGVFMNQRLEEVREILAFTGLPIAQLHGTESPTYAARVGRPCIKAFDSFTKRSLARLARYDAYAFLLDLPKNGPADAVIDPSFAANAKMYGPVFLSGRLRPETVGGLIRDLTPFGIDCCTATERSPGRKDRSKIRALVEAVRAAEKETLRV
jgi:phosphoribosylanthranilate isomerase